MPRDSGQEDAANRSAPEDERQANELHKILREAAATPPRIETPRSLLRDWWDMLRTVLVRFSVIASVLTVGSVILVGPRRAKEGSDFIVNALFYAALWVSSAYVIGLASVVWRRIAIHFNLPAQWVGFWLSHREIADVQTIRSAIRRDNPMARPSDEDVLRHCLHYAAEHDFWDRTKESSNQPSQ